MLSVCSPLQIETTSSFPFYSETRQNSNSYSHSHHPYHSYEQQQQRPDDSSSRTPPTSQSSVDWKQQQSSHTSTLPTPFNSRSQTGASASTAPFSIAQSSTDQPGNYLLCSIFYFLLSLNCFPFPQHAPQTAQFPYFVISFPPFCTDWSAADMSVVRGFLLTWHTYSLLHLPLPLPLLPLLSFCSPPFSFLLR